MSNVHRIGDYDNQPNAQPFPAAGRDGQRIGAQGQGQGQGQQGQGMPGQGGQRMMFMGGDNGGNGPMYPPLNKVLAPNFSRATFIFWISIIQILMFIAELIVGQVVDGAAFVADNTMAGPGTITMLRMGAKYDPCILEGQVFRFLTPALLHAGVLHIFSNLVAQTMLCYTCELHWGFWRIFGFYWGCAFGATLLSCVGSISGVSVGASGALLGIIGCYMTWILLNWNNGVLLPQPCQRMCTMIWWLFIIFIIGISVTGIDNWAHGGGLITGVLLGLAFNSHTDPVQWLANCNVRIIKIISTVLAVAYFGTLLGVTFFVIDTSGYASCSSYL